MNDNNNFQRKGSLSNAAVGNDFEITAQKHFKNECGFDLVRPFSLQLGIGNKKKEHRFDLGLDNPKIIVECKSHKWTSGNNIPSAKITVWNEAMYYFYLAPPDYKKIFFCLKDYSVKRNKTLAEYYIENYAHLIPQNVEIWEYCEATDNVVIYDSL